MLETVIPYAIAVQDTFIIKHRCNTFPAVFLAERLALANANELAGIPDQIVDGTEHLLLSVMYFDLCHDLETLTDFVSTRLSVDRGATWIEASDPTDPFQTTASGVPCQGWYDWHFYWAEPAPQRWTGTGYSLHSRHVFDLFQGYRALWPHFTDPADYLAAWGTNETDTVIQQFILHSDEVHSGKPGWRLPRMFVTNFHVRASGVGVDDQVFGEEEPEVRYGATPQLHVPEAWAGGQLHIHDATGREVHHLRLQAAGDLPLVLDHPPGYYVARLVASDGRQWSAAFVKP